MMSTDYVGTRAEETAREAALARASQLAADLGTAARRDTAPRSWMLRSRAADQPPSRLAPRPAPRRRRFLRFLVAAAVGVAATLAWQSYGLAARRLIAAQLPELTARVPALAALVAQLPPGILTSLDVTGDAPQPAAAPPTYAAAAAVTPASAATPAPPAPEVVRQLDTVVRELAAVRQGMDRLSAIQVQMNGMIARLQADEDARNTPTPPPPKPAAKPAPRPAPPLAAPMPLPPHAASSAAVPPRRP
jgi:hypothetical protein